MEDKLTEIKLEERTSQVGGQLAVTPRAGYCGAAPSRDAGVGGGG